MGELPNFSIAPSTGVVTAEKKPGVEDGINTAFKETGGANICTVASEDHPSFQQLVKT